MNIWKPMILSLSLVGCAATIGAVERRGANIMDEGLVASEFIICQAASVGSIQRRYGQSSEMSSAWRALCLTDRDNAPVPFVE